MLLRVASVFWGIAFTSSACLNSYSYLQVPSTFLGEVLTFNASNIRCPGVTIENITSDTPGAAASLKLGTVKNGSSCKGTWSISRGPKKDPNKSVTRRIDGCNPRGKLLALRDLGEGGIWPYNGLAAGAIHAEIQTLGCKLADEWVTGWLSNTLLNLMHRLEPYMHPLASCSCTATPDTSMDLRTRGAINFFDCFLDTFIGATCGFNINKIVDFFLPNGSLHMNATAPVRHTR